MISAHGLSRSFHGVPAVEDLNFDVPEGRLFALLGPNGAGKTTTVRLLMGLIAPTSGTAEVAGHHIAARSSAGPALRAACGLLTESPGFYDRLSAWANLVFFGRLYGLDEATLPARLERHLRLMDLWDRRDSLVGSYSKGMKQRLAIIRSVFHDPRVVFLDEPTAGLDPEAALMVRDLISRLKSAGHTIIVCTHNLDEAERLADIVGILKRRLLVCASLDELRAGTGTPGARIRVLLDRPAEAIAAAAKDLDFAHDVRAAGRELMATVATANAGTPRLVAWLVRQGAGIIEVRAAAESLESIYLRHMRGES
jgi:ABC-2 type transport system ATP-binding protein